MDALITAAAAGRADELAVLLAALRPGIDNLNAADSDGRTAVYRAARGGHLDCLQRLLQCGFAVNVNKVQKQGATPLYAAAQEGHAACVLLLLKNGADPTVALADQAWRTPLVIAAHKGHDECVDALLAVVSNSADQDRALFEAADNGHAGSLQLLVSKGANVNVSCGPPLTTTEVVPDDTTPIGTRAHARQYPLTALLAATTKGHVACVNLLLGHGASVMPEHNFYPIFAATERGDAQLVRLFIDHGVSANVTTAVMRATPLYVAASIGALDVCRVLVEHGHAAINNTTIDNVTPLLQAALGGHADVVRYLLNRGANHAKARTDDGLAPLHAAAMNGSVQCARLLVEHGADVNIRTHNDSTPLTFARQLRHVQIVDLLVARGGVRRGPGAGGVLRPQPDGTWGPLVDVNGDQYVNGVWTSTDSA